MANRDKNEGKDDGLYSAVGSIVDGEEEANLKLNVFLVLAAAL